MRPASAVRLSLRLARDTRKWWAAVVFGAAAMVVTATYLVFQSLVVSDQQLLDRDLGQYSASIGYGTRDIQPGVDGLRAISQALRARAFDDAFVSLSVTDVPEGGVREGDWSATPFPSRYILQQGEWADEPGEVVVAMNSPEDYGDLSAGSDIELLSGRLQLRVVGVATDRFAGNSTTYLTGPGTWATVPRSTAEKFPHVTAMPIVYWEGSRQRAMAEAFVAGHPNPAGLRLDVVRGSVLPAAMLIEANRGESADQGNLFAYAVPSIGVPLLSALLWWGLVRRRLLGHRKQLLDLGLRPGTTAWVTVGAALPALVVAMLCGTGLGVVTAAATRPLVAAWHDQPLSPLVWPMDPLVRSCAVAAACVIAAYVGLRLRRNGVNPLDKISAQRERRTVRRLGGRSIRRIIAVFAFAVVLATTPMASSVAVAMVLAAACVVLGTALAPGALTAMLRLLQADDFRLRLAARQLAVSSAASTGTAVIAGTVGAAIAFTILLSTMIASQDSRQTPAVMPGQIMIPAAANLVGTPPANEVWRVVESLEITDQAEAIVRLRYLTPDVASESHVVVDGGDGFVLAVDSVDQVEALLGAEWEERFAAILESGGLIRWLDAEEADAEDESSVQLNIQGEREMLAKLEAIAVYEPRVGWAAPVDAVTLTSTARQHGLPLSEGQAMLTGTADKLIGDVQTALRAQGLDTALVVGYQEPPPPIPPTGLAATAALLAATALLMMTVGTAGRVSDLRPSLGALLANGVPTRWIQQCVLFQEGTILIVGLAVGTVFGSLPILASIPRFEGHWVVSTPWSQIAVLLLACVVGSGAAAFIAALRLRPAVRGSSVDGF